MTEIRPARLSDAKRLTEIYDYYVKNTAISFEYAAPTVAEFRGRMERVMARYPYLVAVQDGVVAGFSYAHPFVGRAAYGWSCELTIYLDPAYRKRGLGRRLYAALEDALKEMGVLNLYACIGYPETEDEYLSRNSADFHAHLGFETVGVFHKCGYKFDRWYDMIWMEKIIGTHESPAAPVRGFNTHKTRFRSIQKEEKHETNEKGMGPAVLRACRPFPFRLRRDRRRAGNH